MMDVRYPLLRMDPPMSDREQLLEVAHALGHRDPAVWETSGGLFFATCACGWESVYQQTFVDALRSGVGHALGEAKPVYARIKRSGSPAGQVIAAARERGPRSTTYLRNHPKERFKRAA